jgi:hypothetical protein
MRKRVLMLATTILVCGAIAAIAQTSGAQSDTQQSPAIQATPAGSTTQQQDQVVRDVEPSSEDTQSLTLQGTPSSSAAKQNDQVIRNVEPLQEEND